MKKIGLLILSLSFLFLGVGNVHGLTTFFINDDPAYEGAYWGGKLGAGLPENKDVLYGDDYDISSMTIIFNEATKMMTVKMVGWYFAQFGWGGEDLYLSSKGWKVSGTGPHYGTDTFTEDEGWDYVVKPNDGVYKAPNFLSINWTAPGGRSDQAFEGGEDGIKIAGVSTTISTTTLVNDTFTLVFDYKDLASLGPTSFGVHYTQNCGNDVIEGGTPVVPEPSTLFLLLVGLAGLGIKFRKVSI